MPNSGLLLNGATPLLFHHRSNVGNKPPYIRFFKAATAAENTFCIRLPKPYLCASKFAIRAISVIRVISV